MSFTFVKRIEIPPFPEGKRIALTTSWDDGVVEDRRVVKAFNEWGLKGTFNLNSGFLGRDGKPRSSESGGYLDASEVRRLYVGHEVAIHTVSHPNLTLLDGSQIATEVIEDRKSLEDLVEYPVRGLAYPGGSYDLRVMDALRSLGIIYARTVENAETCFPPAEPLAWHPTLHQFGHTVQRAGDQYDAVELRWNALYNHPHAVGGVFFVWGHSYEFARNKCWNQFERIFKPLSGKTDVWYCTNIELISYESARQQLVLSANRRTAFNPSALPVTINVDGRKMNVPPGKISELFHET